MTNPVSGRRYLALWLPLLSTDRLRRLQNASGAPDERPLVVVARVKSALRIAHADLRAQKLGLAPGMTLADARARVPELDIAEEDAAADAALLESIAEWCDRITPLVGMDGLSGLMLDITGCAHLFGGEESLRQGMISRFSRAGIAPFIAIAGTPDAARALARFTKGGVVIAPGEEGPVIRPLPVEALGIDDEHVTALARAGLRRIGDLADRPRPPLAARFGKDLLDRLCRTLGEVDHPVSPRRPVPDFSAERRFAEPLGRVEDALGILGELAAELAPLLETQGQGGRAFEASFFRTDGQVRRIRIVSGQPLRRADVVMRLFSERMDALADPLDPGFGFDMIRLDVLAAETATQSQSSLDRREGEKDEIAALVDRLGARFGTANVMRFVPEDSHLPERSAHSVPAISPSNGTGSWTFSREDEPPLRPLRLIDPPEPVEDIMFDVPDGPPVRFRWRAVLREIVLAEGPERLAPEWWRSDAALSRDYFRIEDREGRRYWVFREGVSGRETTHPRWFLHGLFA